MLQGVGEGRARTDINALDGDAGSGDGPADVATFVERRGRGLHVRDLREPGSQLFPVLDAGAGFFLENRDVGGGAQ